MLCVGGPKHGEDIQCRGPFFLALRERRPRVSYSADASGLPSDPIKTARYERRIVPT